MTANAPGVSQAPEPAAGPTCIALAEQVGIEQIDAIQQLARDALASKTDVVLDCTATRDIDAAALQVLLALKYALDVQRRGLNVRGLGSELDGRLRLAGATLEVSHG